MTGLLSWGRYPRSPQVAVNCHWQDEAHKLLIAHMENFGTTLPFGNGRSYGDSCLAQSNHVVGTRGLKRFVDADWSNGVITAEAGTTLDAVLQVAIPRGWFLPVTPGTKFVTLGGALANDIHGKNHHHRGTFGRHILAFGLLRSDGSDLVCSVSENAELFAASIGGLGLTGIVTWVRFSLIPIQSSQIDSTTIRFNSLDEFCALSEEIDLKNEYSVAWIDCLAAGKNLGRGVFSYGNHAPSGALSYSTKAKLNVPFVFPISAVNAATLGVFNNVYFHKHSQSKLERTVDYDPFFYPLDGIINWNRIYGRNGFQQYQCALPLATARDGIRELLRTIAAHGEGSFLAVLKRFGQAVSPGLISFPMEGLTLALDFPQKATKTHKLFESLDGTVRAAGGRIYPAKDAHMVGSDFRLAYPGWKALERLRDPALMSQFWKRVTEE
jgi:FAD/FMN-containing dehydrogenase